MQSFFEWYLGIPPAEQGQGTEWTWDYRTPWPSWIPPWVVVLAAVASVIYIGWIYRRDAHSASIAKRVVLSLLRIGVLGLVLLILTELCLVVDRTGLPFIAVLIDDSASMSLDDQYSNEADKAAARGFANASESENTSRLAIAKGILTQNDAEFLKRIQESHQLRIYRFSDIAAPFGPDNTSDGLGELVKAIQNLEASGTETRPGPAIRKVMNDLRGSLPSAIIILSDGICSTGNADFMTTAAEVAARRLVPIFPVAIGSEEAMHDLNLYDMLVDDVAFVNDAITFTAKLKSSGFQGQNVTVSLKHKGQRTPLVSKQIQVGPDGQSKTIEMTWIPTKAGDYEFTLEVTPKPSEIDKTNNSETRQVSVREGRIRVLLVESTPRWEYRELKALLEREKTVELHTILQDADLEFADQDLSAKPLRGRFPVNKEQVFGYDVIILGDINPQFLGPGAFDTLRDFVREAGGGLMMIAGTKFNPVEFRNTALETLLPIELEGVQVPLRDIPLPNAFHPKLTLEGKKSTPIFRFDENEQDSIKVWNQLPGLYWMVAAPNIKSGATVFVEHPTRIVNGRKLPIIVMQRFGAGKIIFHATDETWLWRQRVGDLYFGRYWIQAIRYLSRSRLLGQAKNAELTTDRLVYQRGDVVNLRARFFNESDVPIEKDGVTVVVERRGAGTQEVILTRIPQAPNVFEGQLRRSVDGNYHTFISRPEFPGSPPATDFRVESPEREMRIRGLDRAQLTKTASITRGQFYTLSNVDQLPDDMPKGKPVPIRSEDPIRIWNRWEILVLFTLLISVEWVMRKRIRLT
jgi:uncharacterized membrane protein